MIDIVTVVFEQEIPVLRAQAQSLALYGQKLGIRNIYVVLNDTESIASQIDPAWWGPLANSVLVIPRTAFSTPFVDNGWVSQQVLKLLAASMSYNTYSMILDAKTVFVRELDPNTIVDSAGRIQTGILPLYPVFAPAKKIVDELFEMDLQQQVGPGGVPCIVHNDTVRMMIAEVTMRTRTSFPAWFQSQGMLTEFVLYSAFVQHLCGDIGVLYDQHNHLGSIVNVAHNETDSWSIKINQMRKGEPLTVSVHRGAWEQLTEPQRQEYRDLLLQHGIEAAQDL
tara:strand:+ start:754 stop:1596 length:843 start_codon:yes stop_codon:yes gene_type:complete